MKKTSIDNADFRSPKNGSSGTNVTNLPSTTGKPSGGNRGNNPPKPKK